MGHLCLSPPPPPSTVRVSSLNNSEGNSLAVQWLGLGTLTVVAWVQSLVRELRSHKLHGVAKKIKKQKTNEQTKTIVKTSVEGENESTISEY